MSKRQPSILEVAVSNIGIVRGGRVAADVVFWALATAEPDWEQATTVEQRVEVFARVAALSRRAAWKRLGAFREAFPGETDPTRLALDVRARAEGGQLDPQSVALMAYPS